MLGYAYTSGREFLLFIKQTKFMNTLYSVKNNLILWAKTRLGKTSFAAVITCACILGIAFPKPIYADLANATDATSVAKSATVADGTVMVKKAIKTIQVIVTAYSSTPDQTDDTPFITASGKSVADGIIASNLFPFGTKIRIPKLYGDKIFTVEDRMNKKKGNYMIYMSYNYFVGHYYL